MLACSVAGRNGERRRKMNEPDGGERVGMWIKPCGQSRLYILVLWTWAGHQWICRVHAGNEGLVGRG